MIARGIFRTAVHGAHPRPKARKRFSRAGPGGITTSAQATSWLAECRSARSVWEAAARDPPDAMSPASRRLSVEHQSVARREAHSGTSHGDPASRSPAADAVALAASASDTNVIVHAYREHDQPGEIEVVPVLSDSRLAAARSWPGGPLNIQADRVPSRRHSSAAVLVAQPGRSPPVGIALQSMVNRGITFADMGESAVTVVGGRLTARLAFATLESEFPAGAVRFLWPVRGSGDCLEVRGLVSTRPEMSDHETASLVERALDDEPELAFDRIDDTFVIRRADPADLLRPTEEFETTPAREPALHELEERVRWPWEPH